MRVDSLPVTTAVAVAGHGDRGNFARRRRRLAAGRAERRKIVFTNKRLGGAMHTPGVERLVQPPGPVALQGGALQPVQDQVTV